MRRTYISMTAVKVPHASSSNLKYTVSWRWVPWKLVRILSPELVRVKTPSCIATTDIVPSSAICTQVIPPACDSPNCHTGHDPRHRMGHSFEPTSFPGRIVINSPVSTGNSILPFGISLRQLPGHGSKRQQMLQSDHLI
jgi:hypothetical protein